MSVSNPIHAVFFLFFLIFLNLIFCLHGNTIFCPKIEKRSLLTFKQSLKDSHNFLSSWDGEVNCCKWNGIICNNSTGHVHQLHLQDHGLSGKLNPSLLNLTHLTHLDLSNNFFLGETIPSFMGSFTDLEYLDLSNAGFNGTISYNLGNLSNLHALNLESEGLLHVDSLEWLSRLSKLEYLNMNGANLSRATNWAKVINSLSSLLEVHFSNCNLDFTPPLIAVNLSSLTHIDFSRNHNEDRSIPVPPWIFHLKNLVYLDIGGMDFIGPIPTASNATKLQYLDLSGNHFNSSIPDWFYLCKDLEFVSFRKNHLQGRISGAIANLTSLETLDLRRNMLSEKLPREITNLCSVRKLDVSSNDFNGDVQDSFGNMSRCFLESLEHLNLNDNKLSGPLIEKLGEFKSLRFLNLGNNSLSGFLPLSLGNTTSMRSLWLNYNNFSGNLLEGLGHLSELREFHIENNKLEGVVTESHFANLSKLNIFSASGNHLTLSVGPNWAPPVQLTDFLLQSWSLGVGSELELPSWLQTRRNCTCLDLSNTGISGSIPLWFLDIEFLNVSHNNLHGNIPPVLAGPGWYFLSSNKLSGSLPRIGASVEAFAVSHNLFSEGISGLLCDSTNETNELKLLHLEGNLLSGELPNCWEKWPNLIILKLGNNTLSGSIPNSIWFLPELKCLSLFNNRFSGQIPSAIHNCSKLRKINLSHNNLDGNLPTMMGTSLVNLKFLILRSNKLSGRISSMICHLQSLQILDLSNNQFSGMIPSCVSNFTSMATKRWLDLESYDFTLGHRAMRSPFETASVVIKGVEFEYSTILSLVATFDLSCNNLSGEIPKELTSLVELRSLNLSGNHLTGPIPDRIGDMKQLESLDLSRNSLSGHIPNSLALVTPLSRLNLSFNNLTGRIPEGPQLQTLDASSFIGNNLCGPPLNNCSNPEKKEEEEEGEKSEINWLYVLVSLGYAVGFSATCAALVLKKSWRDAYFVWFDCMCDNIYVYFYMKWGWLTKSDASVS